MTGERLFEGDVIYNPEHRTVRMEICYGKYAAYCPNDKEYMETVGFYMVSNTTDDAMPLGPTKEYALLLGRNDRMRFFRWSERRYEGCSEAGKHKRF